MLISHQMDQRESPDPDDVQRVPEQAPAQQTPQHGGWQAVSEHLRHQIYERDQTAGDVDAVHANESEEGGQKAAAPGPGAHLHHARKFRGLNEKKGGTEHECKDCRFLIFGQRSGSASSRLWSGCITSSQWERAPTSTRSSGSCRRSSRCRRASRSSTGCSRCSAAASYSKRRPCGWLAS